MSGNKAENLIYRHFSEISFPQSDLGPPAGQNKVSVDVFLSKLLGHIEPQGAVLVINVAFGRVIQDGMGVVDLLKLVRCLGVVRVLVGVVFQGQFPLKKFFKKRLTIPRKTNTELLNVVFSWSLGLCIVHIYIDICNLVPVPNRAFFQYFTLSVIQYK